MQANFPNLAPQYLEAQSFKNYLCNENGPFDTLILKLNSYKIKADFLVVIHAEIGDGPEINLTTDIIKFAAEIKAEIGFDVYFY